MTSIELQVEKLSESDSYRGIVRVSKKALKKLNLSPNNYIIIKGKKRTCSKLWTTEEEILRIDEITAENAGIKFGEKAVISPAEVKPAELLELTTKEDLSSRTWLPSFIAGSEEDLLKTLAKGRAVKSGEKLAILPPSENRPVIFSVKRTVPDGFVAIEDETRVLLR